MRVAVPNLGAFRPSRTYYGWWIALSYFLMNAYWSGTVVDGLSVLFNPIKDAFGLSVTVTTLAITLRQGMAMVSSPVVGYLFDRVGVAQDHRRHGRRAGGAGPAGYRGAASPAGGTRAAATAIRRMPPRQTSQPPRRAVLPLARILP